MMKIENVADETPEDKLNIMIAAPCNIGWENMVGDDRVRFCGGCKLNVYNTSVMTKQEIKDLLAVEGKAPCLRIYRRADGTLLTGDCPIGLRKVRDAWRKVVKATASIWAFAVSLGAAWGQKAPEQSTSQQQTSNQTSGVPTIVKGPNQFMEGGRLTSEVLDSPSEKRAMQSYTKAFNAEKLKHPKQADKHYQQALNDLDTGNHDIAFVQFVYGKYRVMLMKEKRFDEVKLLDERLKTYIAKGWKPKSITIIDGGFLPNKK